MNDWRTKAKPASYPARTMGETAAEEASLAEELDFARRRAVAKVLAEPGFAVRALARKQASRPVSPLEPSTAVISEARAANGLDPGITLPLRLGRGLNSAARTAVAEAGKRKAERSKVALGLLAAQLEVTLTRVSPGTRPLDPDNLVASLKGTIDQVAAWLGIDDGDKRLKFIPQQERGPWGVRIEIRLVTWGAR